MGSLARIVVATTAAAVLLVSCGGESGTVHRVVGSGSTCDSTCPPDTARYSLQLAPTDGSLDAATLYELAESTEHRDNPDEYPECVRAVIDGDLIQSWEPESCP